MINCENGHTTRVNVATDAELKNGTYYRRLWLAVKNIKIARRNWLDELADSFRDCDIEYRYPSGMIYFLPDIDDIFPDPEMRWLSDYLKPDEQGLAPALHSRALERLRLLDLYFRVKHPKVAVHFRR